MRELENRTVLITGAASGIGAAIARRFRSEGARVAGLDIDEPPSCDLALVADLRSDAALGNAVARCKAVLGAPDILIHAAAITDHGGALETPAADFADIYDVNVIGAVRLLQLCVSDMREARHGAIVLISSINADFATPGCAAYAASKAALNALTKTAALELAPQNVRVNAIAPASIDTPLLQRSLDRQADPDQARIANMRRHPLARLGSAGEVAELALFLASDRSSWITGGIHLIDGGAHVTRR